MGTNFIAFRCRAYVPTGIFTPANWPFLILFFRKLHEIAISRCAAAGTFLGATVHSIV